MKLKIHLLCMWFLLSGMEVIWAQPKVIAHRGFWKTEGSAQNSIASLIKADSIGCYASEFDVWLTQDNHLVVNHDPHYKGKKMEKSTAAGLTSLQLPNGESLPLLSEYLSKAQSLPNIRLVLELKKHRNSERETQAVKQIVDMVNQYGLQDRTDYISFSLHATKEFIRLSPSSKVYYLNGDLSPEDLKKIGCAGLDYSLAPLLKHPEWIKQAHQLDMEVNVWTINKEKEMRWLIDQGVDYITTNEPQLLQSILSPTAR